MYDVLREITAYVVFLFILLILVYCNRSVDSFLLQDGLRKLFLDRNFDKVLLAIYVTVDLKGSRCYRLKKSKMFGHGQI